MMVKSDGCASSVASSSPRAGWVISSARPGFGGKTANRHGWACPRASACRTARGKENRRMDVGGPTNSSPPSIHTSRFAEPDEVLEMQRLPGLRPPSRSATLGALATEQKASALGPMARLRAGLQKNVNSQRGQPDLGLDQFAGKAPPAPNWDGEKNRRPSGSGAQRNGGSPCRFLREWSAMPGGSPPARRSTLPGTGWKGSRTVGVLGFAEPPRLGLSLRSPGRPRRPRASVELGDASRLPLGARAIFRRRPSAGQCHGEASVSVYRIRLRIANRQPMLFRL